MFELKLFIYEKKFSIACDKNEIIYDEIETFKTSENYNIIQAELKILRNLHENISLTDKCEYFRFLPINRNNIILIIAAPDLMNIDDFFYFIEKHSPSFIRFVKHENFTSIILYFENQDYADNFYYEFNTKSFPYNKNEYLYCIFISQINVYIHKINTNAISEIPSCPLCLEKIDEASIGIHTIPSLININRWDIYLKYCSVCSKLQTDINKCSNCEINNSIWCCMICGYLGCDRYQNVHSKYHFEDTGHRYSIDLSSNRIWDYFGDTWVHRILKLKDEDSIGVNNTIFLEDKDDDDTISSKEFLTRIENIISEYNYVLSAQLEEQRKFYEKEINKLDETHVTENCLNTEKINYLKEEIKKKQIKIEMEKKLYKEYNKKYNQMKLDKIRENIELNREFIKNINYDLKNDQDLGGNNNFFKKEFEILKSKKEKKEELQKQLDELYKTLSN